jgi:ActR/RegA family two-component response regulator
MYSHQELESFYLGSEEDWPMGSKMHHFPSNGITGARINHPHNELVTVSTPRLTERKGTLLILEDFDEIRAFLARHFTRHGFEVFSSATVEGALTIAHSHLPEAIIVDFDLSGSQAYHAVERLRAALPGSFIVLMGGPGTVAVKDRAILAGASKVLDKAYHLGELDEIIGRVAQPFLSTASPRLIS